MSYSRRAPHREILRICQTGGGAAGTKAGSSALRFGCLLQGNRRIPVVFTQVSDPVRLGLVESIARPGGNITGSRTCAPSCPPSAWSYLRKPSVPASGTTNLRPPEDGGT